MSVTIITTTSSCDPREVALDRCLALIEREIGSMSLYQSIAVQRALEAFADDIWRLPRGDDWW